MGAMESSSLLLRSGVPEDEDAAELAEAAIRPERRAADRTTDGQLNGMVTAVRSAGACGSLFPQSARTPSAGVRG
jgi:hypothetical protein